MILAGEVELDEVYIVAGHKGQPSAVLQAGREPRSRRLKAAPGRGTAAKDKPPVLGMIARGGLLVLELLPNVQQVTIQPHILAHVAAGSQVYTDEYNVYRRLVRWGYGHRTIHHNLGEYARDDDGDGFCEVHVNTIEGVWSLLRSWLRPHRGISQKYLGLYLAFFEFLHNVRRRGKAVLHALVEALVSRPRITS